MNKHILLVEDNRDIAHLIDLHLSDLDVRIDKAFDGSVGLTYAQSNHYDLIILDLMLPGMDGLEICRSLRKNSVYTPILMLTAKSSELDRVLGLEIGADDYITKPFHVREVVARVRSVLRRTSQHTPDPEPEVEEETLTFDGISANVERMELLNRNGEDCGLTSGDFKLLKVFLDRPKRVLSRDQLMDLTGGIERNPLDRTIDNQVARLRKKIERNPSDPKLIKTVRGVGYMFAGDVSTSQSGGSSFKSA